MAPTNEDDEGKAQTFVEEVNYMVGKQIEEWKLGDIKEIIRNIRRTHREESSDEDIFEKFKDDDLVTLHQQYVAWSFSARPGECIVCHAPIKKDSHIELKVLTVVQGKQVVQDAQVCDDYCLTRASTRIMEANMATSQVTHK